VLTESDLKYFFVFAMYMASRYQDFWPTLNTEYSKYYALNVF